MALLMKTGGFPNRQFTTDNPIGESKSKSELLIIHRALLFHKIYVCIYIYTYIWAIWVL